MICHQAIAIQFKRLALLEVGDGLEKRMEVAAGITNRLAIAAVIDDVIH